MSWRAKGCAWCSLFPHHCEFPSQISQPSKTSPPTYANPVPPPTTHSHGSDGQFSSGGTHLAVSNSTSQNTKTSLTLSSDDTPSGFLKLSAEIRNKIYCLTLVAGRVTIEDLHPDEWQAEKEAGHATRTSYKTKDHAELLCSYSFEGEKSCTLNTRKGMNAKISYTLSRDYYARPITGMLALNRQTRAEAVPIFYGKNIICFYSMSALIPFLKDRSELSLQSMQHFHLGMEIDPVHNRRRRQEGWAQNFPELLKFPALNLQKLEVHVKDSEGRYAWKLKLDTKLQRWVHEMARNITNLDMLGVSFDFTSTGEMILEVLGCIPTEKLLWEFLAPKMLKKIEDEPHDAQSLLKRRI